MKHSSPLPLRMAADLVKKFALDLGPRLTPEQRRDFARLGTLLEETERYYHNELTLLRQRLAPAPLRSGTRGP